MLKDLVREMNLVIFTILQEKGNRLKKLTIKIVDADLGVRSDWIALRTFLKSNECKLDYLSVDFYDPAMGGGVE